MNKEAVKSGFSGCFETYKSEATVQKQIAQRLVRMAEPYISVSPRVAYEVGCGSGFLTEELLSRYPGSVWLHNDISATSEAYIQAIAHQYGAVSTFALGDAEQLQMPSQIELFASSSAVQWFSDFSGFCSGLSTRMASGGVLAISTFGPDNLFEIKNLTGNGLSYYSSAALRTILDEYFDVLELHEEKRTIYFDAPVNVLRHIKQTGVNGAFRQCWTKGKLASFSSGYEFFKSDRGYSLTYHPIYIVGRCKK